MSDDEDDGVREDMDEACGLSMKIANLLRENDSGREIQLNAVSKVLIFQVAKIALNKNIDKSFLDDYFTFLNLNVNAMISLIEGEKEHE